MKKTVLTFGILAAPSLFLLLWTVDARLVVGRDVFAVALVQVAVIGLFVARWYRPDS